MGILEEVLAFTASPVYQQQGWSVSQLDVSMPFLSLTIAFLLLVWAFDSYLDSRQLGAFARGALLACPKELVGTTEEKYQASIRYGTDKLSFGRIEALFMVVEGIAMLKLGAMPYVWDMSESVCIKLGLLTAAAAAGGGGGGGWYHESIVTSAFVFFLTFKDTLVSLPFAYYRTFIIEARHGFNKSTLSLFIQDRLVSLVLTLAIGSPALFGIVYICRSAGPYYWFKAYAFVALFMLVIQFLAPFLIMPLFNKYVPLDEKDDKEREIKQKVEALAERVKFPLTALYKMDGSKRSSHSNAFFYGFFFSQRIVLYDTLISQVTHGELLAILGHEIGHWQLWHTWQMLIISNVYLFCMFGAFGLVQGTRGLFASFGFSEAAGVTTPVIVGLMLFNSAYLPPVDKVGKQLCIHLYAVKHTHTHTHTHTNLSTNTPSKTKQLETTTKPGAATVAQHE